MEGEWHKLPLDKLKADGEGSIAIGPFGSRMKANRYTPAGVPVIRGTNLSDTRAFTGEFVYVSAETADELRSCNVRAGDLVFPHRGAIGEVGIVPQNGAERYVLSTSLMKFTCNAALVDPVFLFYFFRSPVGRHELLKNASTVGTPGIGQPLTSLKSIEVLLPSLREQQRIAAVLATFDDKIELNRRMNETLEEMARTVFKSWFIDFDPVFAKSEGARCALPNRLAKMFSSSFQSSELGKIPQGWRVAPLPDVVEVNPSRLLRRNEVAPYLDMANMPTRGHAPDLIAERPFGSGMRFSNGDTLVARITPCLENGKTAYVDFLKPNQVGWGSTEYIVLHPKKPLPSEYAYLLARSTTFREFAIQSMTGSSGRQRVPAEALNHFKVAVPSDDEIAIEFGKLVNPLMARASAAVRQSRILAALRDTLLPKLVSGELRLRAIEGIVGAR